MQVWNVLCAARWKCRTQKIAKNSPSGHHHTTLPGYIFATKTRIDNRKKNLLSSSVSPTCPHNIVNFHPLAAEVRWRVWDTPGNFNGFCILAALLHGTLVVGVSQTLWRWTGGAIYIRQSGHSFVSFFISRLQQSICSKLSFKMPQNLKCLAAVPCDLSLITIPISNCRLFSDFNISEGSEAKRSDAFKGYLAITLLQLYCRV